MQYNSHFIVIKMPQMKLQSSDGKIFEVDMKIAKCSAFIKVILEDLGFVGQEGEGFPLSNVKSDTLEKVIKWATHHQDDPILTQNHYIYGKKRVMCIWDAEFLKENQDFLLDLMAAANYLDMKNLFDLTCEAYHQQYQDDNA
ncbi:hypothetical protein WA026_021588 [Henosepilachna vigintioctopunctata]|uniref:SKP1 component POZ domain-containing protein n=1 Tax=Henosepilachna vigintioctopunctata TaxID=420089 RepID=A0AAW1V5Y7_9CUCU